MYMCACLYNYVRTCMFVYCVCIACVHVLYDIMTTLWYFSYHMKLKKTGCVRIVSDWILMGSFLCQKHCKRKHLL